MANFIWTLILYVSTGSIVLICYRAFVYDRKVEREWSTKAMINKVYSKLPSRERTAAANATPAASPPVIPDTKAQAPQPWATKAAGRQPVIPGVKTQAPPPWAAKARRA